jgi:hypothetical protein
MRTKPSKLFLVWNEENVAGDPDGAYFEQYNTLEDAVASSEDPVEVYLAEIKPLGRHKTETRVVKLPSPKSVRPRRKKR